MDKFIVMHLKNFESNASILMVRCNDIKRLFMDKDTMEWSVVLQLSDSTSNSYAITNHEEVIGQLLE